MIRVNVGCGLVYDSDWTNLDFAPAAPGIRPWDLRRGLPFLDRSVDAVYHSHVLEHLEAEAGRQFLRECTRVLRPGGILRVAVPDLEAAARAYLVELDNSGRVDPVLSNWLRLELTDQYARRQSGGAVIDFIRALPPAELDKVRNRVGLELDHLLSPQPAVRPSFVARLRTAGWRRVVMRGRTALAAALVRVIGGRNLAAAFAEGVFRATGEVHRCPYDRVVLAEALAACGLHDIQVKSAGVSAIPQFAESGLEIFHGRVRKPDSLFMEATRP